MKLSRIAVLVVAVVLSSFAALAQGHKSPAGPIAASNAPAQTLAVKHILKGTYVNSCIPGGGCSAFSIPASTYTPVDAATTVVCPGTSGTCLIQGDQWLETGGGSTTFNQFALCLLIDGSFFASGGGCYYNEQTLSDGSYIMGSVSQGTTVSFGSHTVQTFVFSNNGATGAAYTNTYRVYKP